MGDKDGDAHVQFEQLGSQWVRRDHFKSMKRILEPLSIADRFPQTKTAGSWNSCEWKFADGANVQWSGNQTFAQCIEQLEEKRKSEVRPILVKIPAGDEGKTRDLISIPQAINFILEEGLEEAAK